MLRFDIDLYYTSNTTIHLRQSEFLGCYCQTSPNSHVLVVVLPVYQVAFGLLDYLVLYVHLLSVLVVHIPIYYQSGLRKTY